MGFFVVENLREIRKNKYETARDFAQACGLSEKTIHRAEGGKEKIGIQSIVIMAKALEVNTSELFTKGLYK